MHNTHVGIGINNDDLTDFNTNIIEDCIKNLAKFLFDEILANPNDKNNEFKSKVCLFLPLLEKYE